MRKFLHLPEQRAVLAVWNPVRVALQEVLSGSWAEHTLAYRVNIYHFPHRVDSQAP